MKIPIARTSLTQNEIESVLAPLKSGWLVQGPQVQEFEDLWGSFTKSKYNIAVTSCTTALELSLIALGFGPGDEAIVPAFTWISTANVIEHLGGKVIFCDIDIDDFNIDISKIEGLITSKTKAILPVHLFGYPADMTPIHYLAKKYDLYIVEDAACGFGSKIKGTHVGLFGDTGCFSFHPRKAITTGEGGMITTNNKNLAQKIKILRDHGAAKTDLQRHLGAKPYLLADHPEAGYNFRLTDIQAALGKSQMGRANQICDERQKLAENYNQSFCSIKNLRLTIPKKEITHGYQSYVCLFNPDEVNSAIKNKDKDKLIKICKARNEFMDYLQGEGISTRPGTHAVHMLSYYKKSYNLNDNDFISSFAANNCSISIPLFHGMSEIEQEYVVEKIINKLL